MHQDKPTDFLLHYGAIGFQQPEDSIHTHALYIFWEYREPISENSEKPFH